MKRYITASAAIAAVVISLFSCDPSAELRREATGAEQPGSISIAIQQPIVPPLDAKSLAVGAEPASRALAAGGTVRGIGCLTAYAIKIVNAGGETVLSKRYEASSGSLNVAVPPGTYSVKADLFNYAMSESVPIVSGTQTGVTVAAGATATAIVSCTPTNPVALTEGAWSTSESYTAISYDSSGRSRGTERWYSCMPSKAAMTLTVETGQYTYCRVYDQRGLSLWTNSLWSGTNAKNIHVTAGAPVYVCLIAGSNGSARVKFQSIDYVPVTGIDITLSSLNAAYGSTYSIPYTISPANATIQDVTISSSQPSIVTTYSPSTIRPLAVNGGTSVITMQTADGLFQDTVTVTAQAAPFVAWTTATLKGGSAYDTAVAIPALARWNKDSLDSPSEIWYSLDVDPTKTYRIFWDDSYQGSGTYPGDIKLTVYRVDGATAYTSAVDSGYQSPLIVHPAETRILLMVEPYYSDGSGGMGSFAFGVLQQ